jgi:protein gp37
MSTKIEWATETWNPIVGCSKVSAGCRNCYALSFARRLHAQGLRQYEHVIDASGQWSGQIGRHPAAFDLPFKWRKPRLVFVCSMGDLFHDNVLREIHEEVFATIEKCPQHTFLLLTKRPTRMLDAFGFRPPPVNCWCGVTAENQQEADTRIPILLRIPAAVRFVSVEPMLEPIELNHQVDWVICGAETGAGKRPMAQAWADSLYKQCRHNDIPFFGKKDSTGEPLRVCGRVVRQFPNHEEAHR